MSVIPEYIPPDFSSEELAGAPVVRTAPAPRDGVAPENFHGTSNHPEYLHLGGGNWLLVAESRMDAVLVLRDGVVAGDRAATTESRYPGSGGTDRERRGRDIYSSDRF